MSCVSHILYVNPLSDTWFENIFSHSTACLFILLIFFLCCAEAFQTDMVLFVYFAFVGWSIRRCQLDTVDWKCCWVQWYSYWFSAYWICQLLIEECHMVILCLTFWEISKLLSTVASPFYIPTSNSQVFNFFTTLPKPAISHISFSKQ